MVFFNAAELETLVERQAIADADFDPLTALQFLEAAYSSVTTLKTPGVRNSRLYNPSLFVTLDVG